MRCKMQMKTRKLNYLEPNIPQILKKKKKKSMLQLEFENKSF